MAGAEDTGGKAVLSLFDGARSCVICGAGFTSKNQKAQTCGPSCCNKLSHRRRSENAAARRTRVCEQCGASFVMRAPSAKANRGETQEGRFCSRSCWHDARRIYASRKEAKAASKARERLRRGLLAHADRTPRACEHCATIFDPKGVGHRFCSYRCTVVARGVAKNPTRRLERQCAVCARSFVPAYGTWARTHCSKGCAEENSRRTKKVVKLAREARQRGATVELVDPAAVFSRDRWRCQLCGVKTPRKLRGTLEPNAPELDHIVPLSRGGEHSYRNTQCACRACNGAKGAKPLGQLRMFG